MNYKATVTIQSGYATVCFREYGDYLTFERIVEKSLLLAYALIYTERFSSDRTEALFVALTLL